ncbi:hypothetical protein Tco_0465888 [Tanacetum coccineum]
MLYVWWVSGEREFRNEVGDGVLAREVPSSSLLGLKRLHGFLEVTTAQVHNGNYAKWFGINKWYQSFALRNFDLEDMELESTNSGPTAKLPTLKLGEYKMWVIRIKQYFQIQDYVLWEVIENGDSWVLVPQTTQKNGTSVTKMSIHVTAEEKTNKKNDVKARGLLLMALPNELQLTFSQYPDAKFMFAATKTRLDGQCRATNPSVNAASPQVCIASVSDNTVYAFIVENPNGSNVLHKDLEQIHEDDLEKHCAPRSKEVSLEINENTRKQGNKEDTSSKNMKKSSQTPRGVLVGPKVGFKPVKQVYRQVSKKNNVNTSGNKKKDAEPIIEVSNSNLFDVLNSVENDVDLDDEGKPLTKVDFSGDHDSEDEVASVDNDMANFLASKKVGYDTNSHEVPDKIQDIWDNLDIKVRGSQGRSFNLGRVYFALIGLGAKHILLSAIAAFIRPLLCRCRFFLTTRSIFLL